jgi:hypothetical protein
MDRVYVQLLSPGSCGEPPQARPRDVDGDHRISAACQPEGVAAGAAGHIEREAWRSQPGLGVLEYTGGLGDVDPVAFTVALVPASPVFPAHRSWSESTS